MKTKLSHSAINKYNTCARSYKYRYIDRVVSRYKSGALYFGTALDNAINNLLDPKLIERNPEQVFLDNWEKQENNEYQIVELKENEEVTYAESDFDLDLLEKSDWAQLYKRAKELDLGDNPLVIRKEISKKKSSKGWTNLESNERKFYNLMNWFCMRQKGLMMIDAYKKKVLPNIKEVLSIQQYVELKNTDEDAVRGYVDLVVKWKDDSIVLFDNKTSAREYEADSVVNSSQLALYKTILNEFEQDPNNEWKHKIDLCGYIVLRKNIKKDITKICKTCSFKAEGGSTHKTCHNEIDGSRCGGEWNRSVFFDVEIQVIIDSVPARLQDIVLENINDVNGAIKSGLFPRNLNSCKGKFGLCEYYSLCHNNTDKDLVKLKDREEKH